MVLGLVGAYHAQLQGFFHGGAGGRVVVTQEGGPVAQVEIDILTPIHAVEPRPLAVGYV